MLPLCSSSSMAKASLTLPTNSFPTFIHPQNLSSSLTSTPFNSQFFGLKLSHSSISKTTSSSPSSFRRGFIFAKVRLFTVYKLLQSISITVCLFSISWIHWQMGRWVKVQSHLLSRWKTRMARQWVSPSTKGNLWLFISTLLMRPLAVPNRYGDKNTPLLNAALFSSLD